MFIVVPNFLCRWSQALSRPRRQPGSQRDRPGLGSILTDKPTWNCPYARCPTHHSFSHRSFSRSEFKCMEINLWINYFVWKFYSFKNHGNYVLTGRNCNSVEAGGRELVWGESRKPAGDFPRGLCGGVWWALYPTGHPCPLCHHHTYDR